MSTYRSLAGVLFFTSVVVIVWYLSTSGYIPTLDMVREQRMMIEHFFTEHPVLGIGAFSLFYIGAVALSIPIATVLTLLAGFLFGAVVGTIIVVISASIGAACIFILARFFFREYFLLKLGDRMRLVNNELDDHGLKDVLLLRLAPVIPFALINVALALTNISLRDFVLGTVLGIIPFTFVYVVAGMELGQLESVREIISVRMVVIVSLLALSALIPRFIRRRRSAHGARATDQPEHWLP